MNKTLILVVEDDAPLQRMMSAFLGLNGFSIVGAANGEEALNAIDRVMPDLVIADVMMPVMDGFEASRAIRALDRPDAATVPILAMTAQASDECAQSCHQVGMNGRLVKPLDAKKLAKSIREAVQNKQ